MKKNIFLAILILMTLCQNTLAQKEEVQKALNTFLDTVQTRSYMRDKMDWNKIRQEALEQTKNMSNTDSLLPIFQHIIGSLKDYHSGIELNKNKEDKLALIKQYATLTYEQAGYPTLRFSHKMINNKYAYIKLPGVMLEHRRYLDTITSQLKELDSQNPKAWIIDLTENDGGSAYPMTVPFHDLIDTNITYSYYTGKDINGNDILVNNNKLPHDGFYTVDDSVAQMFKLDSIQTIKIRNNNVPIIILTSQLTTSSGEITTTHFMGQKNVTIIGLKTAGLTSGNELIPLSHGYNLNLMMGVLRDRRGKIYNIAEGISPDATIALDTKHLKTQKEYEAFMKESKQIFIDKAIEVLETKKLN